MFVISGETADCIWQCEQFFPCFCIPNGRHHLLVRQKRGSRQHGTIWAILNPIHSAPRIMQNAPQSRRGANGVMQRVHRFRRPGSVRVVGRFHRLQRQQDAQFGINPHIVHGRARQCLRLRLTLLFLSNLSFLDGYRLGCGPLFCLGNSLRLAGSCQIGAVLGGDGILVGAAAGAVRQHSQNGGNDERARQQQRS